jgi:hypothetical protein
MNIISPNAVQDKHKIVNKHNTCLEPTNAQLENKTHELAVDSNGIHRVRCVDCFSLSTRNCATYCEECTLHVPTIDNVNTWRKENEKSEHKK